jgi:hypothetical protein
LPAPYTNWNFWQYSADGNGQGAKYGAQSSAIDLDRFNGDEADLQKFMGVDVVVPPVTPPSSNELGVITKRIDALETWARSIGFKG